ncbi:MAG: ATP-binding cassette domain-containing protein [Cyclobacteriaceae bacterium]
MSLAVKNLSKFFGPQKAVDNVSFEIKEGEIVGFLGPNGAGKSTTMKVATCYLPPSEGIVNVAGFDVVNDPVKVRKNVGYLPEHNPLYLDMYVHEYLGFIGSLHQLKGKVLRERVKKMVALFGLTREQNKLIGALSKGYRQRVGLAQALIHDPKVLILDEPTTGLDPNQIIEIRDLIREVSQEKTVLFSTHIMQEVQAICQRAIIINLGKIVADRQVSELQQEMGTTVMTQVDFLEPVNVKKLEDLDGVLQVESRTSFSFIIKSDPKKTFVQ